MESKRYTVAQVTLLPDAKESHQTRTGSTVELTNQPTKMSEEEARTFLIDPVAFEVLDEKGNKVLAPSQKTDASVQLDPDEVIAKLHELTAEALFNRCLRIPGLEVKKNAKKDVLIDALLSAPKAQASVARGSEGIAPEINTDGIAFKSQEELLAGVTVIGA